MTEPFFSIAIPTKNRPDRVADAVRSVVAQTFPDFELIVCDNSDGDDALRTAAAVRSFGDSRIRYIRTSGQLSMSDNWERAIADARGEFVGILTDRSVFRRDALELVHAEIDRTSASFVAWLNDLYGRDSAGTTFKRRGCTLKRRWLSRDQALSYFLHGHPKFSSKIIPKLMTSVCHRSVLAAIRESVVGRCCLPVCPDYTSGFLMLTYTDRVLIIDDALFVSCGVGTGSDFRRGGALGERFIQDLGMTRAEMVDRMPSAALFSHALVLNDFTRIRDMLPDQLGKFNFDRAQYYVGCLSNYVGAGRRGAERSDDLNLLLEALDGEPDAIQQQVRALPEYSHALTLSTSGRPDSNGTADVEDAEGANAGDAEEDSLLPRFDTVFDALAWDEAYPRTPAPHNFLDSMPGYADQSDKARAKEAAREKKYADKARAREAARARKHADKVLTGQHAAGSTAQAKQAAHDKKNHADKTIARGPAQDDRDANSPAQTTVVESRLKMKRRAKSYRPMHEAKKDLRHWGIVWRGRAHRAWIHVRGAAHVRR